MDCDACERYMRWETPIEVANNYDGGWLSFCSERCKRNWYRQEVQNGVRTWLWKQKEREQESADTPPGSPSATPERVRRLSQSMVQPKTTLESVSRQLERVEAKLDALLQRREE